MKIVQPGTDATYERKVAVINQAILDIGMGRYQWLVFVLAAFGWFSDVVRFHSTPLIDFKVLSNLSNKGFVVLETSSQHHRTLCQTGISRPPNCL